MNKPFSLYIHIPYCYQKCPYCDFNTYAVSTIPEKEYVGALLSELDYRATLEEWRGRTVRTIFFGGGTPSLFTPFSIRKVIASVCEKFPVDENVEVTLEANPGALSHELLKGFHEAGVNRLSLGAQSFNTEVLKRLGRVHTPDQIEASLATAQSVGIKNISIDLIYGVPEQTQDDLEQDLMEIIRLEPRHVSAYGLTIEKGTPFYTSYKKGVLKLPPEDSVVKMMETLATVLPERGYEHYEISNFSRPGHAARHNLAYWNADDYLGLGAGAHSFRQIASLQEESLAEYGRRWCNYSLPGKYMEAVVSQGQAESWHEQLGIKEGIFEFFFLGLRKIAGVDLREFERRFGQKAEDFYPSLFRVLSDGKLLRRKDEQVSLTPKGLLLADSVIENFSEPDMSKLKPRSVPLAKAAN